MATYRKKADILDESSRGMDENKLRGPLSIAIGEVEKITEILQGNLNQSCASNEELLGDDANGWLSARGNNTSQDELLSCLMVTKKLMEEAESENRRLKEDKKMLTKKIGDSLSSVNKEMESLRMQLSQQDRRLNELCPHDHNKRDSPKRNENGMPHVDGKRENASYNDESDRVAELLGIIDKLQDKKKLLPGDEEKVSRIESTTTCASCGDLRVYVEQLQKDLKKSKEGHLIARKERKQLKTDKLELLNQMKQLYGTIEDKERELRDFILNYEQRMKDGEEAIRELVSEKEKVQKDRWEILKHARENGERCVELKTKVNELEEELSVKDQCLNTALKQIQHLKSICAEETKLSAIQPSVSFNDEAEESFDTKHSTPVKACSSEDCSSTGDSGECRSNRNSIASEISVNGINGDSPSPSPGFQTQYLSLGYPEAFEMGKMSSRRHSVSGADRRPRSYLAAQMSYHNVPTTPTTPTESFDGIQPGRGRRSLSETLSRIFNRDKERDAMDSSPKIMKGDIEHWDSVEDDTTEKWETWDAMQNVPMGHWSARAVLVWLEVECCMGAYAQKCAENIRNGRMLLELSHQQVVTVLGIVNPMHKLKLKLAIDEHRTPRTKKSHVSKLDHVWVSGTWLRDLGLSQFSKIFEMNLVDGRMLNTISKKELEKHFEITKKFHQTSFFCGVELLRLLHFNKEALYLRRSNCLDSNMDVVVWTNDRISKWLEKHNLKEFAEKMPQSGIHGALMVFEKSFSADSLTTALAMQGNKPLANRLAGSELTLLLKVERSRLGPSALSRHKSKKSGLTRSLSWRFSKRNSEEHLNKSKRTNDDVISLSLPRTMRSDAKETQKEMSASNGKITSI